MNRGLIGDTGVSLSIVLLIAAAVAGLPILLLVALVLLAITGTTAFWRRNCLNSIEYRRTFSADRAFVGDEIELTVQIVNRKLLPLPWLQVEDELPTTLGFKGGEVGIAQKPRRLALKRMLSLRWYESVTRHYTIECGIRGSHAYGPTTLRSGDIFGFFSNETEVPEVQRILVYPRLVPIEHLGLPAKLPFGDQKSMLRLLEDPVRAAGVREYSPGDSMKQIHWKASARTQRLQVKLQEPSTSLDVLLFLNIITFLPEWQGIIPELLEEVLSVTASLATHYYSQGMRVGLYVNSAAYGSDQQVMFPPAHHPAQMRAILESLAQSNGFATITMEQLIQKERTNLPWGATIVAVTAVSTEGMHAGLLQLRRAGHPVVVLKVGKSEQEFSFPGLTVIPVGEAANEHVINAQ